MKPERSVTLGGAAIYIKFCANDICIAVDKNGLVNVFLLPTLQKKSSFALSDAKVLSYSQTVTVTDDGNFLSCCDESGISLWSIVSQKRVAKFEDHDGEVNAVAFDGKSKYLASGGTDGRIIIRSITDKSIVSALVPKPDFIASLAFDSDRLAASCYDSTIDLIDRPYEDINSTLVGFDAAVLKLLWVGKDRLLSIYQDGQIIVWDTVRRQIIQNIKKLLGSPAAASVSHGGRYLYTCSRGDKSVWLYDLKTAQLISDSYIKTNSAICEIAIDSTEPRLAIGMLDGNVAIYDLQSDKHELLALLESGQFASAYLLVHDNPLLESDENFAILEEAWELTFLDAIKILEHGDAKRAKELLQPFFGVSGKRLQIQKLFKEFEEFSKFADAVKAKRVEAARSMAIKNPLFRKTSAYATLQHIDK